MAGMNDPLTEAPPPSRLDLDDLFLSHSPPLPLHPPFTAWSLPSPPPSPSAPLRPALLLVAASTAASHLLCNAPEMRLLGSVVLPEISMSGNALLPSPTDNACYLYVLAGSSDPIIIASVQYAVAPERACALAKQLLRDIVPAQVLAVGSLSPENFRGQSHTDDNPSVIFRLETDLLRSEDHSSSLTVPYLPSGSLADGICAAILTECQMRGIKGRLLLTLPERDSSLIPSLVATLSTLLKTIPGAKALDFSATLKAPFRMKTVADSDLYI